MQKDGARESERERVEELKESGVVCQQCGVVSAVLLFGVVL